MEHYRIEREENRLWLVEDSYAPQYELKTESIFAQCNGYMGVRAAHSFLSVEESRGMFLCGTFDRAYEDEVTELVNCPDLTWFGVEIDSEKIHTDSSRLISCCRKLDVLNGELRLSYLFELSTGTVVEISVRRTASMDNRHLFLQSYRVHIKRGSVKTIKITTGINGQITNSGVSHFHSVTQRVYEHQFMESRNELKENEVTFVTACSVRQGNLEKKDFLLKRRSIYGVHFLTGCDTVEIEKAAYVFQTGELDNCGDIREKEYALESGRALGCVREALETGYAEMFARHEAVMKKFWEKAAIYIEGLEPEKEAAVRFAQYHMLGMTPPHTETCSIAAKGLTGEGYKGHVFWDTEIFVFPFLLFTCPETARKLLVFRYNGLESARRKAQQYGYDGAMFPWEAARTGEEETPAYAALNIHTGKANRVWSGIKEYHVTADIIYAVVQYYEVTQDSEFMRKYGLEMIFEAAKFWVSCARWDEKRQKYVILDVIGPDEYTEHIDNNAYTNYMAAFCVKAAYEWGIRLKAGNSVSPGELDRKTGFLERLDLWKDFLERVYLPEVNRYGIVPQDDTFLSKPVLKNIAKYKNSQEKQSVLLDYSRDEIVNMQVLKQADVVMLMNLFPDLFPADIVKKNVQFYEKRTIHDSSLSYCAHAQACACIGDMKSAAEFFNQALHIDLNDNPYDSTDGIHSASMGGIWNCLIYGFAGVRYAGGVLNISPHLPEGWKRITFILTIHGAELSFDISDEKVVIESRNRMDQPMTVRADGKEYEFRGYLNIKRTAERPEETERWTEQQKVLSSILTG